MISFCDDGIKKLKIKKSIHKVLNFNLIMTCIISLITIFRVDVLLIFRNDKIINLNDINVICTLLSLLAYGGCIIYYLSTKKNQYFIISLVYLNLFVTIIIERVCGKDSLYIINSILRAIILMFVLNYNENKNIKYKKSLTILVVLLTVFANKSETIMMQNTKYLIEKLILSLIIIIIVICYWVVTKFLSKKSLKELDIIYAYLSGSLSILVIRLICVIFELFNVVDNYEYLHYKYTLITITSFLFIIFGVFFQVVIKSNENIELQEDLKVFYEISESNVKHNIVIFNDEDKLCYANKRAIMEWGKGLSVKEQCKEIRKVLENQYDIKRILRSVREDEYIKEQIEVKGIDRVFELYGQKINTDNNKVYYILRINDITIEYRENEAIKKREKILSEITDNIQDIIVAIDDDGYIKYLNNSAKEVIGDFEYVNNHVNYYDLAIDLSKREILRNTINKKISYYIETSDKRQIELESIIMELNNCNFTKIKKIVVSRDLNQSYKYESLILEYNNFKAQEKIKNDFFINLSHEFKTPLNVIYSAVQLLENIDSSKENQLITTYNRYKKTMKLNCLRMSRMITNMIDILRLDSESVSMEIFNINIVELIEDTISFIAEYAKNKNINLIFDTELEEIIFKCDPEKIIRAITNIVSNSIKFSDDGKDIHINIKSDDNFTIIDIIDEGIGIDEEMRNIIFKPFLKVDKSLTRFNEGSGMGLSIAKSLIELHGGIITVESEHGIGSKFTIKLPNNYYGEFDDLDNYIIDKKCIDTELSDIYELF